MTKMLLALGGLAADGRLFAPVQDTVGTYGTRFPQAVAGMEAESQMIRDVASKVVENAAVAFGLAVGRGTADGSVRLGGTGYEGITVLNHAQEDADQYEVGEMAGVMRKGTIWVEPAVAVADGDPVWFTPATGIVRNSNSGADVQIPNAKFETTTGAGGELARVYLG